MKALLLIALASPAASEPWSCHFTAECQSGRPCVATDWPVQITAPYNSAQAFLNTPEGDVALTRLAPDQTHYATADMLMTISAAGQATLSRHDRPVRSFLGYCENLR